MPTIRAIDANNIPCPYRRLGWIMVRELKIEEHVRTFRDQLLELRLRLMLRPVISMTKCASFHFDRILQISQHYL